MSKAEQERLVLVLRGGGWRLSPAFARVADRFRFMPGYRIDYLGVRLVRHRSALERLAESLREVDDEQEG